MSYSDILPAEVGALRGEEDLLILDIRDPDSFARGHLENAQAVDDVVLRKLMKDRQRTRPVLVYCYHGNSSRDMCQLIADFGYSRVYNLAGGWQAWEQFLLTADEPADAAAPSPELAAWMASKGFAGGEIHDRLDGGMTPLMLAALEGRRDWVEALLALGADPNHVNEDDHHALWFACVHGEPELVSLLIARGGNVDNVNVNGVTCAIYAASTGKLDVLRLLVDAGADLGKETSGGYTALDSASTLPVLKYLRAIEAGRVESGRELLPTG